jgi:prefoldin subunit 5
MPELLQTTLPEAEPGTAETTDPHAISEPVAAGISIDLQDRIRDLEQSLREERRALEEAEERYRDLERKYQELLATQSPAAP